MNFENRRYSGTATTSRPLPYSVARDCLPVFVNSFGLTATPKTDGVRSVQFGQHVRHFSAVNHYVHRQLKACLTLSYRKDG